MPGGKRAGEFVRPAVVILQQMTCNKWRSGNIRPPAEGLPRRIFCRGRFH